MSPMSGKSPSLMSSYATEGRPRGIESLALKPPKGQFPLHSCVLHIMDVDKPTPQSDGDAPKQKRNYRKDKRTTPLKLTISNPNFVGNCLLVFLPSNLTNTCIFVFMACNFVA